MKTYENNWQIPKFDRFVFKPKRTKYCLVIPVINEGEKIIKTIKSLKPYTKLVDIIIADGGSTDGSLKKNFLKSNGINCLLIKTGPGKIGAQYRMAYSFAMKAGYKGVINMDGNGKDDPKAIPAYIKGLDDGYDYLQGSRFIKGGKAINTPLGRYIGIRFILSPILSIGARRWFTDTSNGHRAYSKKLITSEQINIFRDIFTSYEILFYVTVRSSKLNLKIKEIPVTRKYPKGKVPTKIVGLSKNLEVIKTALKASFGYYNPR